MLVLLGIGGFGLVLLLVALIFGEILDGVFDVFNLDFDGLAGDVFSTAGLAGFTSTLGFVGAIAYHFVPLPAAIVVGAVAGVGMAFLVAWATLKLKNSGDDSTVHSHDLVGRSGRVIADIPADGYGIVNVVVNGHITRLNAKAREAIASGTLIQVTDVLTSTAVMVRHGEPIAPSDLDPTTPGL